MKVVRWVDPRAASWVGSTAALKVAQMAVNLVGQRVGMLVVLLVDHWAALMAARSVGTKVDKKVGKWAA